MSSILTRFLTISTIPLILVSCAKGPLTWSESQKSALSTLTVGAASVKADAYQDPAGHEGAQAPLVIVHGGTFAEGAAVNAATSLFVEGANAIQQSAFESKYGASFDQIRRQAPGDVGSPLRTALESRMKKHGFFGSRLAGSSPNRITMEITKHGLVRCGKRDGDVLVSPSIFGTWRLDASGKNLASGTIAAASPSQQRTVTEFAARPSSLHQGYREAADRAAQAIMADLDDRLGSAWNLDRGKMPAPERSGYAKVEGSSPERLADIKGPQQLKTSYSFSRDYNSFVNQPNQGYAVEGHDLLISSTSDGGVLLVLGKPSALKGGRAALGDGSYHAVRKVLEANGVRIARQRAVKYIGVNVGYVLELTGDGASVLAPYKS